MAKLKDSDARTMTFRIGKIDPKEGSNGTYHIITAQGAAKGFICFDKFPKGEEPKVGDLWWSNWHEKGDYKNFKDFISDSAYTGPRDKEAIAKTGAPA